MWPDIGRFGRVDVGPRSRYLQAMRQAISSIVASPAKLLGVLSFIGGGIVAESGRNDIQIGIGASGMIGGLILYFLGQALSDIADVREKLAATMARQQQRPDRSRPPLW